MYLAPPPAPPGDGPTHTVTLRDVAAAAGVSVATASRALTPGFSRISPDARQRVQAAAGKLGYRPNISARATSTGSTSFVAVVVSDMRDSFSTQVAHGVSQAAAKLGLVTTIAGSPEPADPDVIRQLRGMQPRAIVLVEPRDFETSNKAGLLHEITHYLDNGGHVCLVGESIPLLPRVSPPWFEAGHDLICALAGLGYRRPVALVADVESAAMVGWRQGLAQGGQDTAITVDHVYAPRASLDRDGGYEMAASILASRGPSVDAFVCATDMMAVGVIAAVKDAGLVPGADIGITGCDNLVAIVETINPHITSVDLHLAEAGEAALQACLGPAGAASVTLHPDIALRATTPARQVVAQPE